MYTDNSKEFIKTYQELSMDSRHEDSSSLRNNGIAERAVRRVNEGTAAAMAKVTFPKNGGTGLWNGIATCGTCTARWPTARQRMRGHMV